MVFVPGVGALGEGVLLEFMGLGSFFLGFLFLLGDLWSWAAGKGGLGNLSGHSFWFPSSFCISGVGGDFII